MSRDILSSFWKSWISAILYCYCYIYFRLFNCKKWNIFITKIYSLIKTWKQPFFLTTHIMHIIFLIYVHKIFIPCIISNANFKEIIYVPHDMKCAEINSTRMCIQNRVSCIVMKLKMMFSEYNFEITRKVFHKFA